MKSLALVERHPVLHLGRVFLLALASAQGCRALFECQRENACGRILAQSGIPGDNVTFNKERAVNIIPHVLGADADLDIGAGKVIRAAAP